MTKEVGRLFCGALLIASDTLALAIAFIGSNMIYFGELYSKHGLLIFGVLCPIYIGAAGLHGGYSGLVLSNVREAVGRSLRGFLFAVAAVLVMAYFLKVGAEFSRVVFSIGFALSLALLPIVRVMLRQPFLKILGGDPYLTVVIRDGIEYKPAPGEVLFNPEMISFDVQTNEPIHFHNLAQAIGNADRLVVACTAERYESWATVLKSMRIHGELLAHDIDRVGVIGVGQYRGRRTMIVALGPLTLHDRIIKRIFDLLFASAALVVLSPVLLAVALAIRLESDGAILFKQERIGRDNKIFRMYKFRSMYVDLSDADAKQLTSRNDRRMTKVGKFIRRTSIDELPQLINVLKGDMSIVGPRPHAIAAKAADLLYWDVDSRYRHRHAIKPGLTGLAQIRGFRGATDRAEDLTNRLVADLEYASDWSMWKDVWIILRTLRVLRHDNAF